MPHVRSGTCEDYNSKIHLLETACQLKCDADDRLKALKAAKKKEQQLKKKTGDLRLMAMRASRTGEVLRSFCLAKSRCRINVDVCVSGIKCFLQ